MKDPRHILRAEAGALAILACVAAWDAGWLTRQAALLHRLVVGVLPPALALWGMERTADAN